MLLSICSLDPIRLSEVFSLEPAVPQGSNHILPRRGRAAAAASAATAAAAELLVGFPTGRPGGPVRGGSCGGRRPAPLRQVLRVRCRPGCAATLIGRRVPGQTATPYSSTPGHRHPRLPPSHPRPSPPQATGTAGREQRVTMCSALARRPRGCGAQSPRPAAPDVLAANPEAPFQASEVVNR